MTDKQETMVKITTGADLGETPVISRKVIIEEFHTSELKTYLS